MNKQDCVKTLSWFVMKANNACWKISDMTRNKW